MISGYQMSFVFHKIVFLYAADMVYGHVVVIVFGESVDMCIV